MVTILPTLRQVSEDLAGERFFAASAYCQARQRLPALIINPERPERIEPRCIKRHMKEYDLMTQPRHELRKRLKKRRNAA